MTVKLKTPSNGSVSLTPQDTASDVVVTVPAGTSTMVTNATLPTQLNASGSAPIYACRAWVNFNGTGTVAIRASGNVTSITDNANGDYTVNFTTAMPDANYSAVGNAGSDTWIPANLVMTPVFKSYATTSVRMINMRAVDSLEDGPYINVAIFR